MNNQLTHQEMARRLQSTGARLTARRRLILDILEAADEHLDAEDIYLIAKEQDPDLSLSTVYRALNVLKEARLVEQRYFARDHKRGYYEATDKREHYHFTCVGCGQVIEVRTPRIAQARRELSEQLGLVFTHACICFEGYCATCATSQNAEPPGD